MVRDTVTGEGRVGGRGKEEEERHRGMQRATDPPPSCSGDPASIIHKLISAILLPPSSPLHKHQEMPFHYNRICKRDPSPPREGKKPPPGDTEFLSADTTN